MAGIFKATLLNQIKTFIIVAVLCPSTKRVCGAHLRVIVPGQYNSFEEISLRSWAVGNTVSDLTGLRFKPQTSSSRDERIPRFTNLQKKLSQSWQCKHWLIRKPEYEAEPVKNSSSTKQKIKLKNFINNFRMFFPYEESWQLYNSNSCLKFETYYRHDLLAVTDDTIF